jgi:hypothetical protein
MDTIQTILLAIGFISIIFLLWQLNSKNRDIVNLEDEIKKLKINIEKDKKYINETNVQLEELKTKNQNFVENIKEIMSKYQNSTLQLTEQSNIINNLKSQIDSLKNMTQTQSLPVGNNIGIDLKQELDKIAKTNGILFDQREIVGNSATLLESYPGGIQPLQCMQKCKENNNCHASWFSRGINSGGVCELYGAGVMVTNRGASSNLISVYVPPKDNLDVKIYY